MVEIGNRDVGDGKAKEVADQSGRTLTAVLACPPTTSGVRTRNRLEQARRCLGFDTIEAVNLFSLAAYRTTDMSLVGNLEEPWLAARPSIESAIVKSDAVLLAYGVTEPAGQARAYHRAQLAWLNALLSGTTAAIYSVGCAPRHPSRWHRWTRVEHPGLPFELALSLTLRPDRP